MVNSICSFSIFNTVFNISWSGNWCLIVGDLHPLGSHLAILDLLNEVCNTRPAISQLIRKTEASDCGATAQCSPRINWIVMVASGNWARIFKLLRSSWIDFRESIPPAYVAWRARVTNPIPTQFITPIGCLNIPALGSWWNWNVQVKVVVASLVDDLCALSSHW